MKYTQGDEPLQTLPLDGTPFFYGGRCYKITDKNIHVFDSETALWWALSPGLTLYAGLRAYPAIKKTPKPKTGPDLLHYGV